MTVSKNSWHYKLVAHKNFVRNLKEGNCDAVSYIVEVFVGASIPIVIISLMLLLVVLEFNYKKDNWQTAVIVYILLFIISSPLWFCALTSFVFFFLPKKWKELRVV
jgi:ABC-type dipeptide/oligopeptide/nickel transport system permease component